MAFYLYRSSRLKKMTLYLPFRQTGAAAPEKARTGFLHAYLKGEAPLGDLAESEQLNFLPPD